MTYRAGFFKHMNMFVKKSKCAAFALKAKTKLIKSLHQLGLWDAWTVYDQYIIIQ